ncbi:S8 family serine peptidase [Fulvimarina manganoxydans]|uniref:S8 family serine peptidase n=1 Tax=Fulvimarina manganoxydans TaxID=937218 RepID=UPI001482C76D|nr:S8 family serine peptidase [Fulvimarina manganoxydans]
MESDEYKADWGLAGMNASYAYALGYTGEGIKLGEVDSGIYAAHPEFADGRIHPLDISGTYLNDGYRYENLHWEWDGNSWHLVSEGPWDPSRFEANESFDTPGVYDGSINGTHGTHVGGSIAAARDGKGMHGVAYLADLFTANTGGTDGMVCGPSEDYNYFKAAYGAVAEAGARVINTSWGQDAASDDFSTLEGLMTVYSTHFGKLTWIDAVADVVKEYGEIQTWAAGNNGCFSPVVEASLPYFRPELERNWIAVGASGDTGGHSPDSTYAESWSTKAGVAKYWTVFAPGINIYSTVAHHEDGDVWSPEAWGVDPNNPEYTSVSGTSMAAPHATGALGLVMQRYAYLGNQEARDVLLTTAQHMDAVEGTPDDTTGLARNDAPNEIWGWGAIDLKAAMNGPGQFLGAFTVDMDETQSDVWYNTITEDALIQRHREDIAEQATWQQTLADKGWDETPPTEASSIEDQVAYEVGTARAEAAANRVYEGSLIKMGDGTLALMGEGSTYSGGTVLKGGTLEVGALGAAGTGAIEFTDGAQTLRIDHLALSEDEDHSFANLITDFANDGDVIEVCGIGSNVALSFDYASDLLQLIDTANNVCQATLQLDGDYGGKLFTASYDGEGTVQIELQAIEISDALRSPDNIDLWAQAAETWESAEYEADWGLAGMNASYAYALGYTGEGIKLGEVDSGIYAAHPEFAGDRIHPLDISGTYLNDGYSYEEAGWVFNYDEWKWEWIFKGPIEESRFSAGDEFETPGVYSNEYNDPHGTHVGGTIAANRDGEGMHGVAFDANLFLANTHGTDGKVYGANSDYNYFLAAYGANAEAGARAINTSWGTAPGDHDYDSLQGLTDAYSDFFGSLTHLDAMYDVSENTGVLQVIAAGNDFASNPDIRNSIPYFRPDYEDHWISVGASHRSDEPSPDSTGVGFFSDRAGVAKYWTVFAPGLEIYSAVPPSGTDDLWSPEDWSINPDDPNYTSASGTSMAAPHATGALGLVMQRYAYLGNQEARDVLLTTAQHMDAVEGTPDDTTGLARNDAPNEIWGWGAIDLKAAMNGPGQFLGAFTVDMDETQSDVWYNTITEDALIQRHREDIAEQATWQQTLADKGWDETPPTEASSIEDQVAYEVGTARAEAAANRVYEGSLIKMGDGTLALMGEGSTYSGGTVLKGGTLEVGALGAAGTGAIEFTDGAQTLRIDHLALSEDEDHSFANLITDFANDGDVIEVCGIGSNVALSFDYASDLLQLIDTANNVCQATLQLDGDYGGKLFTASYDGEGTVQIELRVPVYSGGAVVTDNGSDNVEDEIVTGTAGDDVFSDLSFPSNVAGGDGFDAIVLPGNITDFILTPAPGGFTLTKASDSETSIFFSDVEAIRFDDITLERHDDPEAVSLYSLYQTVFGRAAEINGLSFWFNEAEKGLSMHDIATSFAQSDEFQTTYGVDPSPETLVDGIYANIFGREPDPAGEAFWLDAFQNGLETADFLTAFSDATELHTLVENAVDDGIFLIA